MNVIINLNQLSEGANIVREAWEITEPQQPSGDGKAHRRIYGGTLWK